MRNGIFKISYGNLKNLAAEKIYTSTSIDLTKPTQIFAIVNKRCVSKCVMCDSWRVENPTELDAAVWIKFLQAMQRFNPYFNINFTGGEPLFKSDFLDILTFCSDSGILAGFTTNGILLTKSMVDSLMCLNIFNIHVSIDSMDDAVHDKARGIPGVLKIVKDNLSYLLEQKAILNNKTPVFLKTNVFNENLDDLEDVVVFCREKKLNGVIFQPILKWTKSAVEMFQVDLDHLQRTIEKMISLKRRGYPIVTSENQIMSWMDHFTDSKKTNHDYCRMALRSLTIHPNGDIMLCDLVDSSIGNIQTDEIGDVWYSARVRKMRSELIHCAGPCDNASSIQRNFNEYMEIFQHFVAND